MRTYKVDVVESRYFRIIYTVEAANQEEALDKAHIGDTIDESIGQIGEVFERYAEEHNVTRLMTNVTEVER